MSAGSLADGFVELQLKTDQMQAEMRQVIADTSKTAKTAEEAFNNAANKGVKRVTSAMIIQRMEARKLGAEYRKIQEEYRKVLPQDLRGGKFGFNQHTVSSDPSANVMGGLGRFASGVGAAAFGASALVFSGAAMAGSTTMDTLTGSLKMLSLAAGTKTQAGVMKVSGLLQQLAKATKDAPNGVVGGVGGAVTGGLIGMRFGGPVGGLIGSALGGLGVGMAEKGINDFADKRKMVEQLKADPNHVAKLLKEIQDLEKDWWAGIPFVGNNVEVAKRKGAIRAFEAKQKELKDKDPMLTAGLPGGGGSVGLVEYRQEPTTSGEGALGIANKIEELKLNLNAVNFTQGWRATVNPLFVGPPAP